MSFVDNSTLKYNKSSSVNPDGTPSTSEYITFRFTGHKTYGVIRIQDHSSEKKLANAVVYNVGRTTYTSEKFKMKFGEFLKYLETRE